MRKNHRFQQGSVANFLTLLVGLALGFLCGYLYSDRSTVFAQAPAPAPEIQEVTPGMRIGSIGAALLLVHEANADSVVVNGFDLMKLHENTLNYLATRPNAESADIQNIINKSKAAKIYRVKAPEQPPQQALPPPSPATTPKAEPKP